MFLYRIGKTKFARDLSGLGSRLNGGRWNHEGVNCIYTSESRALALLEYTAHVSEHDIPRALSFSVFDVPGNSILEIPLAKLPGNWKSWPHSTDCRDFGTGYLKKAEFLLLKIPSAIIQEEYNYLINPAHPDVKNIKIIEITDYSFDLRLKHN